MLDFTIGLTEGVAWPWPIAVYLFLAGISGEFWFITTRLPS